MGLILSLRKDLFNYFSCLNDFERVKPRQICVSFEKTSNKFRLAATVILSSSSLFLKLRQRIGF